jgi:hypothetical protein
MVAPAPAHGEDPVRSRLQEGGGSTLYSNIQINAHPQ